MQRGIGHVMMKNELKPNPNKVEAIAKMEHPLNVAAVQWLVGLLEYLSKS